MAQDAKPLAQDARVMAQDAKTQNGKPPSTCDLAQDAKNLPSSNSKVTYIDKDRKGKEYINPSSPIPSHPNDNVDPIEKGWRKICDGALNRRNLGKPAAKARFIELVTEDGWTVDEVVEVHRRMVERNKRDYPDVVEDPSFAHQTARYLLGQGDDLNIAADLRALRAEKHAADSPEQAIRLFQTNENWLACHKGVTVVVKAADGKDLGPDATRAEAMELAKAGFGL